MSKRVGAIGCVLLLAMMFWVVRSIGSSPVEQPIRYSHKIHVQEVEMECVDCHVYVESQAHATIPNIEICGQCHDEEPLGDSSEERKVIDHVGSDEPIPWRKVYRLASHVYFSHRRHTALAGIDCAVCHGEMKDRDTPLNRQLVPITMTRCLICHEQNGVSTDCVRCHR